MKYEVSEALDRRIFFVALDISNLNNLLEQDFVSLQVEVEDLFFFVFSRAKISNISRNMKF